MAVRWLAILPPVAFLVGVLFANSITPYVLGLPFLWFYISACVVFTALVMIVVYVLDPANKGPELQD
jgi:dolichyl-phosphate-mannose--protein O-mannosyl transferase